MANMFSGKNTKKIPTSLNECRQEDATVNNLHKWAEFLETFGKIVFYILILVGFVVALYNGYITYEYQEYGGDTPGVLVTIISKMAEWAFYAFVEYCAYHVLALLISALASITQNTIISANVALYEASQNCASHTSAETASGSVSSDSIVQSPKPNGVQYVNHGPAPDGMWLCDHCGTHNSLNYGQCKKCGKYKT